MARRIGWICLAFSLVAFFADNTEAQILFRVERAVQAPFRYLGHGNGPGYHYQNRGPDSSYYNPWSQKNSFLISKSPQFLARYGNELRRTPIEILQYGNVTWGQQQAFGQSHPASNFSSGVPLSADFVPATKASDEEDKMEKEEMSDDKVQDRFEEEADAMDEADETGKMEDTPFGSVSESAIGGFNSLKDALNTPGPAATLQTPSGTFRPASHSGR